jgi:microsomal dipeptidase-like Zn-dependent dipeptidase
MFLTSTGRSANGSSQPEQVFVTSIAEAVQVPVLMSHSSAPAVLQHEI